MPCSAALKHMSLPSEAVYCVYRYGGSKYVVKELAKFKDKDFRGHSLELLNLDGNMQSLQLYSEFYRGCRGGHPSPEETNQVFRNQGDWLRIKASNWM